MANTIFKNRNTGLSTGLQDYLFYSEITMEQGTNNDIRVS